MCNVKFLEQLKKLRFEINELAIIEDMHFSNLSEGLQMSERGMAIENSANALQNAVDTMDDLIDLFQE